MRAAAEEFKRHEAVPFAGYVSDPCDGRTQGTQGMMDSLAYRNDAAITLRRLIRSLPTRRGVMGVATCDKGLPAMMMALGGENDLPGIIVPGGVTLLPDDGEDCGKVQSLGARYAHGEITLDEAAQLGCRAGATAGGGCQFMGTAATSQVVSEALGLTVSPCCPVALRPGDLVGYGPAVCPRPGCDGIWRVSRCGISSARLRSTTPWWSTPRWGAAPTYCCTSLRLPMRRVCPFQPSRIGSRSTG